MSISEMKDGVNGRLDESSIAQSSAYEPKRIFDQLDQLNPAQEQYALQFVDKLVEFAVQIGTSDVHLQPTRTKFEVRFRSNGVLERLGEFEKGTSTSIVSRVKVLSGLLTYISDMPQEGRIIDPVPGVEVRVSTFPTLHGERIALRFFGNSGSFTQLRELGHTPEVAEALLNSLDETSGALMVTGPAGSGKSTTLFACLRHLVDINRGNRCLMSLEDPIEVPIDGVSQSQVNLTSGFDLHTGLRSLLRQDPEVIMIGEIRDAVTAEIAIQACLTGQLMMTTFHAENVGTTISRLLDLGIDPYLIRSGINGILSQRLLRKLCKSCCVETEDRSRFFGLPIDTASIPKGCPNCNQTGYQGRILVSEYLSIKDSSFVEHLLEKADSREIYKRAVESGMKSIWERATELVRDKITSPREVRRVLGVTMRI
ncbi:MAG: GspE/PulE family protein [Planctomycetota bacterium]